MKRFLATYVEYKLTYYCKTIIAEDVKHAMEEARSTCFNETLKSLQTIYNSDNAKVSTPEGILKMLNKLEKEYNKEYGTIQAKKIDAIIRFYTHLIALDEITEEYIREIVE